MQSRGNSVNLHQISSWPTQTPTHPQYLQSASQTLDDRFSAHLEPRCQSFQSSTINVRCKRKINFFFCEWLGMMLHTKLVANPSEGSIDAISSEDRILASRLSKEQ